MATVTAAGWTGELSFASVHSVGEAESRAVPDSRTGGVYRPTQLRFAMIAYKSTRGQLPRYRDLKVTAVVLHGMRLKKDGTPGLQRTVEYLTRETAPDWARAVIDAELAELTGGTEAL